MARNPRDYPDTLPSPESSRPMVRGNKLLTLTVEGHTFEYRQPGWWCSLDDPEDLDGQLVDGDNQVAEMAKRTARAIARDEPFPPAVIRSIRVGLGLTQREAGEMFGSGPKSFEKYEAGEIQPSQPTQRLLDLAMERPDLFRKPARGEIVIPNHADIDLIKKTMRAARLDAFYEPLFQSRGAQQQNQ